MKTPLVLLMSVLSTSCSIFQEANSAYCISDENCSESALGKYCDNSTHSCSSTPPVVVPDLVLDDPAGKPIISGAVNTISGSGFVGTIAAAINGRLVNVVVVDGNTLQLTVPNLAFMRCGPLSIDVTRTLNGQSLTQNKLFNVDYAGIKNVFSGRKVFFKNGVVSYVWDNFGYQQNQSVPDLVTIDNQSSPKIDFHAAVGADYTLSLTPQAVGTALTARAIMLPGYYTQTQLDNKKKGLAIISGLESPTSPAFTTYDPSNGAATNQTFQLQSPVQQVVNDAVVFAPNSTSLSEVLIAGKGGVFKLSPPYMTPKPVFPDGQFDANAQSLMISNYIDATPRESVSSAVTSTGPKTRIIYEVRPAPAPDPAITSTIGLPYGSISVAAPAAFKNNGVTNMQYVFNENGIGLKYFSTSVGGAMSLMQTLNDNIPQKTSVKLDDLNCDGYPDILVAAGKKILYYPSAGPSTYSVSTMTVLFDGSTLTDNIERFSLWRDNVGGAAGLLVATKPMGVPTASVFVFQATP